MEKVLKYLKTFISSKGDWKVFAICTAIATVLWLFQSMGREYSTELAVEVAYVNRPSDKTFSEPPPEEVKVKVQGFGWDLLSYKFNFRKPSFEYDVSNASEEMISSRDLIMDAIPGLTNILSVTPERFQLKMEEALERRVPVISSLQITAAPGFGFVRAQPQPDSVTIFGPTSAIEGVKTIYTSDDSHAGLERESIFKAQLVLPEGVALLDEEQSEEVEVVVLCEPLNEKELEMVIKVTGYSGSKKVNIYPRLATLKLTTTNSQFDKIDPSDLEVFVDLSESQADDLLEVQVINNSRWVSGYRVSPKYVDYFLDD